MINHWIWESQLYIMRAAEVPDKFYHQGACLGLFFLILRLNLCRLRLPTRSDYVSWFSDV
jgi:hypothetical protein